MLRREDITILDIIIGSIRDIISHSLSEGNDDIIEFLTTDKRMQRVKDRYNIINQKWYLKGRGILITREEEITKEELMTEDMYCKKYDMDCIDVPYEVLEHIGGLGFSNYDCNLGNRERTLLISIGRWNSLFFT